MYQMLVGIYHVVQILFEENMRKLFILLGLIFVSFSAYAAISTVINPPFVVDSESERDVNWPDKTLVYCKDTKYLYSLQSHVFVPVTFNMAITPAAVTRSLVSTTGSNGFQISTTQRAMVNYSVSIVTTLSLSGGQNGTVILEMSSDNTTWTEVQRYANGNTGTLTLGLNTAQTGTACLSGFIPVGYYVRLRTLNNTGTPTYTYNSGQEALL